MNYFARSFLYLSCVHLVLSEQVASVENRCYTSSGVEGVCLTQQQCLASQSSNGASSSKHESILETCRIENDGTPVICCILNTANNPSDRKDADTSSQEDNDTYTYVELDSSQNGTNKQSNGSSEIESRFFNGPRKRQYYNYNVSPYQTPISNNLIPQYDPVYNDVYSYQNKRPINNVNSVPSYNSFAVEPPVNQQPYPYRPSSNNNNYNNNNNNNYNSYNTPSRNPTNRPVPANNNPSSWQSQSQAYYSQQTTRRPSSPDVIFKQTSSGSTRLSTAANRYDSNGEFWQPAAQQTTQRRQDVQPVWGEVPESTTTTRVIRTPRPTESYQNQNQNQNQNQYNNNNNNRPSSNNQNNNQNQYNNNQNQYNNNNNNNNNQYNNNNNNQYNNNNNNQNNYNSNNNNQNSNRPTQQQKRISEEKCAEYSKIVTTKVSAVPLSIATQVATVEKEDCPYKPLTLIVGGSKASLGEFPHMAALGFKRGSAIEYSCGGTLISEEHILTAAHCIKSALGDPVHVRLGDLNLEKEDDGAEPENVGIQQIFVHPRYKHPQLYHDIAVIKLSRKVHLTKKLRPACLFPVFDVGVQQALATGWGSTNYGETASDDLLKVVLNIIDNKQCSSLYGTDTKLKNGITNDMLCAGELSGKRDTCQGDSGGPLQFVSPTNKCLHYVIGITSFGRSCGVANSAGIYTRVSQYIDWIESVVWNN